MSANVFPRCLLAYRLATLVGLLSVVPVVLVVHSVWGLSGGGAAMVVLLMMPVWVIPWQLAIWYRCPRCGQRFCFRGEVIDAFMRVNGSEQHVLTAECLNCGFPRREGK